MKQSEIDEKTQKILALNDNPEKIHEFMCACMNAKSTVENKLMAETLKTTISISMKNLFNNMNNR